MYKVYERIGNFESELICFDNIEQAQDYVQEHAILDAESILVDCEIKNFDRLFAEEIENAIDYYSIEEVIEC